MTGVNMKINQGRVDEKASKSQTSFSEVSPQSPCTYSKKNGEEIKMEKMDSAKRIEALEEARNLIKQAIELIKDAIEDTSIEDRAEAYILPSLKMCLGSGHGYLGSQPCNIDEMIEDIEEDEEDNLEEEITGEEI